MSRDVVLTAPDGEKWSLDNLSTQRWLEGHAPGAEAVVAWMLEHAVKLFREGEDAEAKMVRELAGTAKTAVVPVLRASAQRHAEEFPERVPEEGAS